MKYHASAFIKNASFLFFLALLPLLPVDALARDNVLNILYTGAIKGELEPCGCSPKTESGGLARLSGYITANKNSLQPYLLIDAGNSMPAEDTAQGRLKAEAVIKSFGIMGYDAAAFLGRRALPGEFLSSLIKGNGIPAVHAGSPGIAVERGDVKIHVGADPAGRRDGHLNVLLTDVPLSEAKAIKGWDAIITSSGEIADEPQKTENAVVVSGYPRGQKLGVLTLRIDAEGRVASVSHRWQGLGKDIKEDPRVRAVLREYDGKVANLVKDEERMAVSGGPYIGAAACAACHQPFAESWSKTKHSAAYKTLEAAGKSKDPECVRCHTTGYGREGFYGMSSTPGLANVQCEACHGQGREHAGEFSTPMRPVNEETCRACHTQINSPEFDYKTYHERIKH